MIWYVTLNAAQVREVLIFRVVQLTYELETAVTSGLIE